MKYGIYVPNFGEFADVRALTELAREAEERGWDGFFLWDHVWPFQSEESPYRGRDDVLSIPPLPLADCWVTLEAVALRTERIRIGPLITPLARRRPQKLARETVTLDHLSGGRLILGVGLGAPRDSEFARFGEDSDDRVRAEKLDEGLEVLTGLWTGKPFSYDGRHYEVRDVTFLPQPVQKPRIPIWVAGLWPNKAPFRRAARYDGAAVEHVYFERQSPLPEDYRAIWDYIRQHRTHEGPFDMTYYAGDNAPRDPRTIAAYAEAGVTWWLEAEAASLTAARERIRRGPPRAV